MSFGAKIPSGGKGGAKLCPVKKSSKSSNKKAGLTFPVGRVNRYIKKGRFSHRVGSNAPIFMAAILEYVVAEVLEVAGNNARAEKKTRLRPRHVMLAIEEDQDLKHVFKDITIAGAGVAPGIQEFLQPKKDKVSKKQKEKAEKKAAQKKALLAEATSIVEQEEEEAPVVRENAIIDEDFDVEEEEQQEDELDCDMSEEDAVDVQEEQQEQEQ
jgi:histone H2A